MAKNNKKIRDILFALSTEEERDGYLKKEKLDEVSETTKEIKESIKKNTSNEDILAALKNLSYQVSKIKLSPIDHTPVVSAIQEMTTRLSESNRPQDYSGFFKDFGTMLVETNLSSNKTKELITNLKWNSSMQLRNANGSPISPAISPFQIPDYTDVQLSNYDANGNPGLVNYYLGAGLVATLALTYDGSGNLTEAKRN